MGFFPSKNKVPKCLGREAGPLYEFICFAVTCCCPMGSFMWAKNMFELLGDFFGFVWVFFGGGGLGFFCFFLCICLFEGFFFCMLIEKHVYIGTVLFYCALHLVPTQPSMKQMYS